MAVDSEKRPTFRYTICPRWLDYSGLPRILRPARWAVFKAIVELDHQTEGLPSRRCGPDNLSFTAPLEDVASKTALDVRTVGRKCRDLRGSGLLEDYVPGQAGRWSQFRVHRRVLQQLYMYVAPMLRKMHGGMQNAQRGDRGTDTQTIYSMGNGHVDSLIADEFAVLKIWQTRTERPEAPDLNRVKEICGIGVHDDADQAAADDLSDQE